MNKGWARHNGEVVALAIDNIDTDQLIPARFMSRPRSEGYADLLLYDMRRDANGNLDPHFALNARPSASILIAGSNFGSGSSREAAVYALIDAGIKTVIATSFGDIFKANAVNNGLLPACVTDEEHHQLASLMQNSQSGVLVDLEARSIQVDTLHIGFQIEDALRTKLINGWDDIDLTLNHQDIISDYRSSRQAVLPWLWPSAQR